MIENIATKFDLKIEQVMSIISNLQQGWTISYLLASAKNHKLSTNKLNFIADYAIEQKELEHYKKMILDFWQGKITPAFKEKILATDSKLDLYVLLPSKNPKEASNLDPEQLYNYYQSAWQHGVLHAKRGLIKNNVQINKYRDFLKYENKLINISAEHAAILLKGRNLNCLQLTIHVNNLVIANKVMDAILYKMRYIADTEILKSIDNNFNNLLNTPIILPSVSIGIALNSGLHLVVLDINGQILDYESIYAYSSIEEQHASVISLAKLCLRYRVKVFIVANNSKQRFVINLLKSLKQMYSDLHFDVELVNDAGSCAYSHNAGLLEYPDIEPRYIEAISIAKRKINMLTELVKISPKDLLLHNYQKDVGQKRVELLLQRRLIEAVSKNFVDINVASKFILQYVPGLDINLAALIVKHRDVNGEFKSLKELKNVSGITDDVFAQAGFFLRVYGGEEVLDAFYIHPDEYVIVHDIANKVQLSVKDLVGNTEVLNNLNVKDFANFDYAVIKRRIFALGATKLVREESKLLVTKPKQVIMKEKASITTSKLFNPMMANAFLKLKHRSE